jgi:anthranilate phosphoribosyltransferase
MAEVLKALGSRHVLVVHGEDGLDEISIAAPTRVVELKHGEIREWTMKPEDVDLTRTGTDELRVGSARESLDVIQRVFAGVAGPAADTVAFNAGAALYAAGHVRHVKAGVEQARAAIVSGAAARKLADFARLTQGLGDD